MARKILDEEDLKIIIKDITRYFRDIYRVWIEEKDKIGIRYVKEKPTIGAIQFSLIYRTNFLERVRKTILYLNNNPHIGIEEKREFLNPYEIEGIDDNTVYFYISLREGKSNLLVAPKRIITSNIYENRWAKGFLISILKEMNRIVKEIEGYEEKVDEKRKEKLNELKEKIKREKKKIIPLMNLDFLKDLKPDFGLKPTSVIKYNPIYHRIYKFWFEFNSFYLPFNPELLDIEYIDEWKLFELWVFFKILDRMKERFEIEEVKNFFEIEKGRIKLKIGGIKEGKERACIEFKNKWKLYYQKCFHDKEKIGSYTVPVTPDFTIVDSDGNYYIFDAKEMLIKDLFKEGREEKKEKRDPISQIHQYKECIRDLTTGENVVKGAYIIIPKRKGMVDEKYYDNNWRKKWGFGILIFDPKEGVEDIWEIF